ncbi:MBL fold metallo-hydrolase [Mucilaginibacter ginkgonis]|uniref:MBL fold metallo-hydrolase n=1 Tax=Mucilaginibacter ginkgonis TaxID=2682091 RepID=A0A7T7FEC6_9SPHI|nr:MBL fold metallo-hydrolase [Mucilaginibacter ginkgonis]
MDIKAFGKLPADVRKKRIKTSLQYRDGSFQNILPTAIKREDASYLDLFKTLLSQPKTVRPGQGIPSVKTDLRNLNAKVPTVVWFGHSSYLISHQGFNIFVDPVLSGHASPVSFFGKAFLGADIYKAEDMPDIDVLLITHDHYDHLDYETITKLHPNIKQIVTSLGAGSHLEYWGIAPDKITELDWWQSAKINQEVEFTATPARHFSGRGLKRGQSLWSSFVLKLNDYKIFLGGDSGYDGQFKVIGDKFGPFDLALLECGQYNINWPDIHMMPEQTAQAAQDLQAKVLMPVHWAKFTLSVHPWNEPPIRVMAEAKALHQPIVIPQIGEPYAIGEEFDQKIWWE